MNIYHCQIRLRTFHQINFFWYWVDRHHRHLNLIHFLIYLIQLLLVYLKNKKIFILFKIFFKNFLWFIWAVFLKRVPSSESSSDMFFPMFEVDDRFSACPEALSRKIIVNFCQKVQCVLVRTMDFYGFHLFDIIKLFFIFLLLHITLLVNQK